jgi:glutaredoxin
MYYIKIIVLKKCTYCNDALNILKKIKKDKLEILEINDDEKHYYKTDLIKSFPQIFLKKYNSKGSLLIGGYDNINFINNNFKNKKAIEIIKKQFPNFSLKATLRIIQLFLN